MQVVANIAPFRSENPPQTTENVINYSQLIIDRLVNAVAKCHYIIEDDKTIAIRELNRLKVDLQYANRVKFHPHKALYEIETPAKLLKIAFFYAAFDIPQGQAFWCTIREALTNQEYTQTT